MWMLGQKCLSRGKGWTMRLIDADALIDDLMERYCKECNKRKGIKNGKWRIIYEIGEVPCRACEVDDVKAELEEAPTADVPDRKVGKWIDYTEDGYVECPFCHSATNCDGNKDELHFCFSCGAKMEEEG